MRRSCALKNSVVVYSNSKDFGYTSMQTYEVLVVLPGTLTAEEVQAKQQEITKLCTEHGAEHVHVNDMGKHRLAYEIRKARFGWFTQVVLQLEPARVKEVQMVLQRSSGLLRFAIRSITPETKREFSFFTGLFSETGDKRTQGTTTSTFNQKVEAAPAPVNMEELDKKLEDIIKGETVNEKL